MDFKLGNIEHGYTSTATAAGTTTLVNNSTEYQVFTGTTTQTIKLPDATTFAKGIRFFIINLSSGILTIKNNSSTVLTTIPGGNNAEIFASDITTSAGVWQILSVNMGRTINNQTGTTYTFALSDGSSFGGNPLVTANNASTQTYTVPPNSSVAFPVGTQMDLIQLGAGKVTFSPGSGVTINSLGGLFSTNGQYVGVTITQIAANSWILNGNLIA